MWLCLDCSTNCIDAWNAVSDYIQSLNSRENVRVTLDQVIRRRNDRSHWYNAVSVCLNCRVHPVAVCYLLGKVDAILLPYLDSVAEDLAATVVLWCCPTYPHYCILIENGNCLNLRRHSRSVEIQRVGERSESESVLPSVPEPVDLAHLDRGSHCECQSKGIRGEADEICPNGAHGCIIILEVIGSNLAASTHRIYKRDIIDDKLSV